MADDVVITMTLSGEQAEGLAQLVKRLHRRNLGKADLNLVSATEQAGAEEALSKVRAVLEEAGFDPR
jgi:hypothetical protein